MANNNHGQGGGQGGSNPGQGGGGNNEITIHMDKKQFKSPSPTTGAALYTLGQVATGYDLWREVHGKGDDELIANNATQVILKNGDHFYTAQSSLNPGADHVSD
ncbi:hypothetical protein ABMA46_14145 [Mesorhizobium sp. CN5-321]|jgi:hypothetical protein|uniref:hypothetical protein n=1 Tax=Mesorhizobium hunchu TaxID=3157708 RepID=UPI0032B822FA